MADISTYLQKILDAVYGEEVRSSIYDALAAMNKESSSAMEYASTAKDSAQTFAGSAMDSASIAIQKAEDASSSAKKAAESESKANTSEINAESKAVEAAGAAQKAKTSEINAANSETAATQKASEASKSEIAAKAAQEEAAKNASLAQQYSGKPPKPLNGTWWIWNAEQQLYVDSGIRCELIGPAGNGIESIAQTSGNHAPGSTDIYTITMTDGTTRTLSIYNGRNGIGAGDVLGIAFDLVLPASGWNDGQITISDSRLLAQSTTKYFVVADELSSEEYSACHVRARDIKETGFITFTNETDPTNDLTVNIIRLELSVNGTT